MFFTLVPTLIDNQLIIRRLWGVRNVQKQSVKECWFFDGETLNLRVTTDCQTVPQARATFCSFLALNGRGRSSAPRTTCDDP